MEVIKFVDVNKDYILRQNKPSTLKEYLINRILKRSREIVKRYPVLKGVSFSIKKGETVGIIGENGAGKSTILKLISKIIYPDSGIIETKGRIAALLEIGTGFHPDLTGRENVFLYGSLLGMSHEYIKAQINSIIDFSEIGDFIDQPVKNYSSGMYMRLAFAVAIHVEPEILLIDEVLAVGDEHFQKKCLSKIDELRFSGKTILFVSHDMATVRRICNRVILVNKQGETSIGPTDQMVNQYLELVYDKELLNSNKNVPELRTEFSRWGNKEVEITNIKIGDKAGKERNLFWAGEDIVVNVSYTAIRCIKNVVVGIAIYTNEGIHVAGPNSKIKNKYLTNISGKGSFKFVIPSKNFLTKKYILTVALYDEECLNPYDHLEKCCEFAVINNQATNFGAVDLDVVWEF